jgi:hypothetical protein
MSENEAITLALSNDSSNHSSKPCQLCGHGCYFCGARPIRCLRFVTTQKADYITLGRVFKFGTDFDNHHQIMLIDANNNGVFEVVPLVGDDDFFSAEGLDHFEDSTSLTIKGRRHIPGPSPPVKHFRDHFANGDSRCQPRRLDAL